MAGSLLVVTGPPGAGKSTVARVIAERRERGVLVDGDTFFTFVVRGAVLPWLEEADDQNRVVLDAAASAAGRYAAGGYPTVYDGVVIPRFVSRFLKGTGLDRIDYALVLPSVEECVQRVLERVGHGFIDEGATRHMHASFADASLDQRHVIADPPEDAEAVADVIEARVAEGTLTYGA